MNKRQLFLKLLILVVGGIAVFLLSSCLTSLRILSCKKSCVESCNSCNSNKENISGHEYGIYYTLDKSGEFYWVSEVGYYENSVKIPETYEGYPVMGIRSGAFTHYRYGSGCGGSYSSVMSLSSLTLTKTIKFIDEGVFANDRYDYYYYDYEGGAVCDKIVFEGTVEDWCDINFGSSPFNERTTFYIGGEKVTNLVIPESVIKIKANSFARYCGLKSLTLHENLTEIENNAFYGCNGLTGLTFPCKDLKIGEEAFSNCRQVEKITFTGEKVVLGKSVFSHCYALKEVEWNSVNVTEIPEWAFYNCFSMTVFVIPASVEAIEEDAFDACSIEEVYNLSKLDVTARSVRYGRVAYNAGYVYTEKGEDSKVVTVGNYKFVISDDGCKLFKYIGAGGELNLLVPDNVESYIIMENTFAENANIQSVNIPACVTEIGARAFYSCENLQIVTGCEGVVTVGDRAFSRCAKLERMPLEKVEEIGDYAFSGCIALTVLELPETLTKIGKGAFTNCSAEIKYAGTLEDWEKIVLSDNPDADVRITCSDGEVWEGKI